MNAEFKKRLLEGRTLLGTLVTLPSPEMAELLSQAGYDWMFVDAEHSAMGPETVQRILQAVGGRVPCLVRVPSHEENWVKKVLDMGPEGIIAPLVNSGEQARRLADLCQYPPQGKRSVGIARAHGFGPGFGDYLEKANEQTSLVVQIEHIEAVGAATDILSTPGVDAVFVGPYDLSASMGKTGRVSDPEVVEAIDHVLEIAQGLNKPVGIFAANAAAALPWLEKGVTLAAVGTDALFTSAAAGDCLKELRKATG